MIKKVHPVKFTSLAPKSLQKKNEQKTTMHTVHFLIKLAYGKWIYVYGIATRAHTNDKSVCWQFI